MSRRLAIVVSTPAERGDFARAVALAGAARAKDVDVALFLMDAGVDLAADARATALLDDGCDLVACSTSLVARGVEPVAGVVSGSQDDHAALVRGADRVVAFT